jgi:hypothetical protein
MDAKVSKQPSLILLGQCSFTCRVLKELIQNSFHPSFVAIEETTADNDPFEGLMFEHEPDWFIDHHFYHHNWKEALKTLCEKYSIPYLFQKNVICNLPLHNILIVGGYAKKIPVETLDAYKEWAINIHPSKLPMYKGPQPEAQVILNNAGKYAGVTLHRLTDCWDSGEIYFQKGYDHSLFHTVGQMESIGARIAVEGIASLLNSYPNVKELDINNSSSSSYHTWYEEEILNVSNLNLEDPLVFNKLRLRPEGYAFLKRDGLTIYPIVNKFADSLQSSIRESIIAVIVKREATKELVCIENECIRYMKGMEI